MRAASSPSEPHRQQTILGSAAPKRRGSAASEASFCVLAIRTTDFPDPTPTEISQGVKPDPVRHAADQKTLHAILESLQLGKGS